MDTMFSIITDLVLISLEVLYCKLFVGVFSKDRRNIRRIYELFATLALIAVDYGIVTLLEDYLIVKIICITLAGSSAMCLFYKDRWRRLLMFTALFYGVGTLVDYVVLILLGKVYSGVVSEVFAVSVFYILLSVISRIVLWFVVLLVKRVFDQKSAHMLTDMEWMKLLVVPVISTISAVAMVQRYNMLEDLHQDRLFLYIAVGLAVMNIDVFYLVEDILQREKKISEALLFKEKVENETAWYYSISENLERQRKTAHEYKNHTACITALVQNREYDKLEEYLHKLDDDMAQRMDMVDTNNVIVNAIVNTKYQEFREKGIVFVLKVNDLSGLWLEDKDIVVLLTNMLSNAAEACETCQDRKVIRLKTVIEDEQLIMACSNSISKRPEKSGRFFMTTKEDMLQEHGFGVKNMIDVVEKYDGQYVIDYDDKEFLFSSIFSKKQG